MEEEPEVSKKEKDKPTDLTITVKMIKSRNERSTRRLQYLGKRLKEKKPQASTAYWDKAREKILQILQQAEEVVRLDDLAQIETADVKSLVDNLRQQFETIHHKNEDEEETTEDVKEDEETLLKMFWKLDAKHYFEELFEWLQDNFEYVVKKFYDKFYIEEDAINYIHQSGKEFVQNIFL